MHHRKKLIAILILSLVGLATSLYLTYLHIHIVAGDMTDSSLCDMSRRISCSAVAASPQAEWFGIPIAWLGAMVYLMFLIFTLIAIVRPEKNTASAIGLILVISAAAVVIDGYLAYIMAFEIGSLCLFCVLTYALNIVILFLCLRAGKSLPKGFPINAINAMIPMSGKTSLAFVTGFILVVSTSALGGQKLNQIQEHALASFDEAGYMQFRAHAKRFQTDVSSDPFLGARDAALTIIEFSDFQCPHCRKANRVLESILPVYLDRVKLVFKNMPIGIECNEKFRAQSKGRDLHPAACALARLGEAAYKQGRFWPTHDLIFSRQKDFGNQAPSMETLLKLAEDAGLDVARAEKDMASPETKEAIRADLADANRVDVNGTPTFLLNGLLIRGLPPPKIFQRMIEIELAASKPQ